MFQVYFTSVAEGHSLVVELNQTRGVEIKNAYDGTILKDSWTYIGVSFMALYYPSGVDKS
jgi:hypothetical protein